MPSRWFVLGAWLVLGCSLTSDAPPTFEFDRALRPAQAAFGEVVATVHLFQGTVQVRAANLYGFQAQPGCPLLRTDTLEVGRGSFVVLHLRNNRLTRIEADQKVQVTDVALLDAAPSEIDLEQQLVSLLSADERAQSERIVGWHARKSAALTVAAEKEELLYKHKSMKDFSQAPTEQVEREREARGDSEEKETADLREESPGAKPDQPPPDQPSPDLPMAMPPPQKQPPADTRAALGLKKEKRPPSKAEGRRAQLQKKKVASQGVLKVLGSRGGGDDSVADLLAEGGDGVDLDEAFKDVAGLAVADGSKRAEDKASGGSDADRNRQKAKAEAPVRAGARLEAWLLRQDGKWHRQPGDPPAPLAALIDSQGFTHCLGLVADPGKLPQVLTLELHYRAGKLSALVILSLPSKSRALACLRAAFARLTLSAPHADADLRILVRLR